MRINSTDALNLLLAYCRSFPHSNIKDGKGFYKIKSQDFLFPDGSVQTREYIDKRKASVVVPITEEGNIVFVVQPTALTAEGSLIEFPAGYWELNEDGMQAGIRELSEETGYVPDKIIYLGSHYQDPGSIRQKVEAYIALGCKKIENQHLDRGEFIKYIEVSYEFAQELMEKGYLKDANTYIALNKSDRVIQKSLRK